MYSGAEILTKCPVFFLTTLLIALGIATTTSQQPELMERSKTETVQKV